MATRLGEILERIRPAGAPGAPTEGEFQKRHDRSADEIAAIAAVLAAFEAEADAVVDEARAEAKRLHAQAERRVHEITSALPDRVAVAESRAAHRHEEADRAQIDRVRNEAAETIADLQARAAARTPMLVQEAMAAIWSQVSPGAGMERPT